MHKESSSLFSLVKWLLFIVLLCSVSLGFAMPKYVPGQLIFKTESPRQLQADKLGLSTFDSYLGSLGLKGIRELKTPSQGRYFLADVSSMPSETELLAMRFAGIEYVQPNYLRKMHTLPNDPLYSRQVLDLCSIPQAWQYTTGSGQIIVAVIDSGLLVNHPDLAENVYYNSGEIPGDGIDNDGNGYVDDFCGWDFVHAPNMADVALGDYLDEDNDVTDENYHGTHVSGIIGAKGNNGIGIAGVNWNVKIMPLRAGFRTVDAGFLQDSDVSAAIIYAADNGAKVINMSWGDTSYSPIIADACDYAYNRGITLVASAGNDGTQSLHYPAALSNVISVGSVGRGKLLSSFSSHGQGLDLVAPGENILSTYKGSGQEQYYQQSGTSMSAPFVSGAVALLLSIYPNLSPDEVKARLLTATDDLYTPGYDIKSGHGLLNVSKLINNTNPPFIRVDFPIDEMAINRSCEILGSVYGDDFWRYTLMYRNLANEVQWLDTQKHTTVPTYYYEPVNCGKIGDFYLPNGFAEGEYQLRIQYERLTGDVTKYSHFFTLRVMNEAPRLKPGSVNHFARYRDGNLRHYIAAVFDDKVLAELKLTDSTGADFELFGSQRDSLQVFALPPNVATGSVDISLKAYNLAGLSYQSPLMQDFCQINYHTVATHGFSKYEIGAPRIPLNRWRDFDHNGKDEYVAMELVGSGYGSLAVYEPHSGTHIKTKQYDKSAYPLDLKRIHTGTNGLLALEGETAKLYKSLDGYPSADSLAFNDTGITGGIIADYNGDGVLDLVLVKNLPNARVIQLYERTSAGIYAQRNQLFNTSATQQRNNFVPTVLVEDFMGLSRPQILAADTDGDVMLFKVINNQQYETLWEHRLGVPNAYQLAAGDFDGDGRKDFIIGGYNTNPLDENLNFWQFEAFKSVGGTVQSMGKILFDQVESISSISTADIDGDGKDEVILAIAPHLYIIKYDSGAFKPVFKGDSFQNYRLAHYFDEDGSFRLIANSKADADSVVAVEWIPDAVVNPYLAPDNLFVQALGEDTALISWEDSGADAYKLYRKDEAGDITLVSQISAHSYLDEGLTSFGRYFYAISALYGESESMLSAFVEIRLDEAPEVLSAVMVSQREIRISFSQAMPYSSFEPLHYELSHQVGHPLTVVRTEAGKGAQLKFRRDLPFIDGAFTLSLRELYNDSGIALVNDLVEVFYQEDTTAPMVLSAKLIGDNKAVWIEFSESIEPLSAAHLANYRFSPPENDLDNFITSVTVEDSSVIISLNTPAKASTKAYFVEISNITDLAGNILNPSHSLARFSLSDISDLSQVVVFPNPLYKAKHKEISFMNFPEGKKGKIAIYNASGALVYQSAIGPFRYETNYNTWRYKATNLKDKELSSGVYYYIIEMDKELKKGKFAIVN